MNTLVGKKLSAVSHKVNTTRLEILGVRNVGETQLVFHDTPGLLQKRFGTHFRLMSIRSSQEEKELTNIAKKALSSMDMYLTVRFLSSFHL